MADLTLVYGGTGSWKTTQLLFLAKYAYKKWAKRTRLASCDGGGWKPLEPAVEAGLIQPWNVSAAEKPRTVLRKISQGFWPEVVTTPKPHLALREDRSMADRIGVLGFESLTSVSSLIMRDALNQQLVVAGDQKGEKGSIKFDEKVQVIVDGVEKEVNEKYSFATQGNYGDAQKACYDFVMNLRSLPIPLVFLSALECRAEEEDTGKTILGPGFIGKAMTPQAGAMVGDMIHMEDFFVDEPDPTHVLTEEQKRTGVKQRMRQVTKVRAWFTRHPDIRTGMLFPAKPRIAPDMVGELLSVFPGGYFEPKTDSGLDAYLEVISALQTKSSLSLREWMKNMDVAREAASKVGGGDAPKADASLVKATIGGTAK